MDYKIALEYSKLFPEGLVGIWLQGSKALGYADNKSDEDYVFLWEEKIPNLETRIERLKILKAKILDISDRKDKGSEYFKLDDTLYNTTHILKNDFLNIYPHLIEKNLPEDDLYRLGGFTRGIIVLDSEDILKTLTNSIKVTNEIINAFIETRRKTINRNLQMLKIAGERKQVVEFVKSLNFLLITFHILSSLNNKQMPTAVKWVEREIEKYNLQSGFSDAVLSIGDTLEFEEVIQSLIEFGKNFGYKPSEGLT